MRITESRLRRLIRSVIRENYVYEEDTPMDPSDPDYELVTDLINTGIHDVLGQGYDQGTINGKIIKKCFDKGLRDMEKIEYIMNRVHKGMKERIEGESMLKSIGSGMDMYNI